MSGDRLARAEANARAYLTTDEFPDGWIETHEITDSAAPDLILARDVLALVEIAEAAREAAKLLGAGYDNDTFDDRAFVVLRDALARLDGGVAEEQA